MSEKRKFYLMLTFLLLVGYAWVGYHVSKDLFTERPATLCLFKKATGIPCPSCGTTRSVLAILRGNFIQGIHLNPLGWVMLSGMLLLPLLLFIDLINRRPHLHQLYLKFTELIRKRKVAWILILMILLNWIWNIQKEL